MTCQHWWKIEFPEGPTSKGRCKLCGEERDGFRNSEDYYGPEAKVSAHTMYSTPGPLRMAEALLE